MQSAYVEYKDLTGIFMEFSVLVRSVELRVYIWKSIKGLRRNTNFRASDYVGAYVAYPYRKKRGLFGELHLMKNRIGAGYVAHELQHFFYDWLMQQEQTSATNERLALLAGDMTREFWNEYYRRIK